MQVCVFSGSGLVNRPIDSQELGKVVVGGLVVGGVVVGGMLVGGVVVVGVVEHLPFEHP